MLLIAFWFVFFRQKKNYLKYCKKWNEFAQIWLTCVKKEDTTRVMWMCRVFTIATASSTRRQLTVSLFWRWGMSSANYWKVNRFVTTVVLAFCVRKDAYFLMRSLLFLLFRSSNDAISRRSAYPFVAKKVKRKKYRGLGNERISKVATHESAKVNVMENKEGKKTASRRAKCFDVLCVCVNENIFQKGDISPLAETIFY